MKYQRLCIYPKDVQLITGRTERYGCKLLTEIKKKLNKTEHQFVSIDEFCNYTGLDVEQVKQCISL